METKAATPSQSAATTPSATVDTPAPTEAEASTDSINSPKESSGPPSGAIAGIVIGVLAMFILLAAIFFWRRRKMKKALAGNEKFLVIADPNKAAVLPDPSKFAEVDGAEAVMQPSELPASPLARAPGTGLITEGEGAGGGMGATLASAEANGDGRTYVNSWSVYGETQGASDSQNSQVVR